MKTFGLFFICGLLISLPNNSRAEDVGGASNYIPNLLSDLMLWSNDGSIPEKDGRACIYGEKNENILTGPENKIIEIPLNLFIKASYVKDEEMTLSGDETKEIVQQYSLKYNKLIEEISKSHLDKKSKEARLALYERSYDPHRMFSELGQDMLTHNCHELGGEISASKSMDSEYKGLSTSCHSETGFYSFNKTYGPRFTEYLDNGVPFTPDALAKACMDELTKKKILKPGEKLVSCVTDKRGIPEPSKTLKEAFITVIAKYSKKPTKDEVKNWECKRAEFCSHITNRSDYSTFSIALMDRFYEKCKLEKEPAAVINDDPRNTKRLVKPNPLLEFGGINKAAAER
jgi:hypothetical protein